jgi:outer membrane biosynthesis protein TonB
LQELDERSIRRRDGVTIPHIWIAVAFSIVIHAALLWTWRYEVRFPSEEAELGRGPLIVNIAPPPSPPPAAREVPRTAPPAPTREARARPRAEPKATKPQQQARKPAPDILARAEPVPSAPAVPAPPSVPPATQPAPPAAARAPEGDLSSFVEARRRARGEAAPAPSAPSTPSPGVEEDANARATRLAAANLGSNRKPSFGSDPRKGGGVFGIERLSYDSAEFTFFGWNKDIQRNTMQLIEVRKGDAPDIRIAVIRRMIAIIREQENEDFIWESKRLGRNVLLSARQQDNRGLEDFLMREFF